MADALKTWLRTRLGVIMDLTPEAFSRYTRDGSLLAHILHSYDIISSNQLSTILCTRDPALCRVNLKTLGIWLKLINVTLNDECIDKISKGKGAASLQLFYKVYLSLEGKDRLHFIALQKERRYMPSRFIVSTVSEHPVPYLPTEHPLSTPLIEAADTVLWHRNKFWAITEACRRERERFESLMEYPVIQPMEYFVPEELPDKKQKESERLEDKFTFKRPARKTKKRYQVVECCPSKSILDVSCIEDPAAAAEYVGSLKKRSKKTAKSEELKLKTQTTMMAEAWERLLRKQDRSFDEALGRKVLGHSRYEKQMLRKLCEVRDLRNRIVENRRIVDAILLKVRESERRLKEDRREEAIKEEREKVEMEVCRMRELRRRIREEKVRKMKEKHQSICSEIINDLADISVKIAVYRQENGNHIPNCIWNEWKMLFLKNQPIFEPMDHFDDVEEIEDVEKIKKDMKVSENDEVMVKKKYEARKNSGEEIKNEEGIKIGKELKAEEKQRLFQLGLERQQSLADADFESYRDLSSPWDQFVPKREAGVEEVYRLGRTVLGYIVHRLLEILYPYPAEVMGCPVPRVKVAAIVLGVTNATSYEQLRGLLKNTEIRLLTMEDAINHCLESYKREMRDVEYIDLNIISATARDIKRLDAKNKMDDLGERHLKKIERSAKLVTSLQRAAEEKQTQTPKHIPYDDMDPILSDAACIGKWTYEFLTLGQPISNELNTKILIEYLKGIGDVEGWILINYPNTYEQMAMLEKALTGREIPAEPVNLTDIEVEDIDPLSPRIVFESDEVDIFAISRHSKLLPNPISKAKDYSTPSTTFMTMYIKAVPKPKAIDSQEQPCIPLPDDATSMDGYYANQNIAYGFFYNVFDLPTLKQLVKLIMDHFHERKSFLELSEKILQTYHDEQKCLIDSKAAVIKRLIPKSKWKHEEHEEKKDIKVESHDLQPEAQTQLTNDYAKPGESSWQWLDFFQPPALLEILATLWENVEQAYIEHLKEIFFLKRMHISAIMPYKNLVFRNLMKFVDRPDKRQILLQDFHRAFNEIDKDLREDLDMKCELHCRVDDFRTELWELCDARRYEAEEERRRTLCNQWILMKALVLVNVYIGILQTEIDRFVDTMQLLQDYYTSMLQKPLQESPFSKIVLDTFELEDVLQETSLEDKERMVSETKTESSAEASALVVDKSQLKTELETLLIDVSKSFDPDQSTVYIIIKDNVRQVRDLVDSVSSVMLEMLKKEEKAVIAKIEIKGKGNASFDTTRPAGRNRDLVEEWRYAVLYEIGRIRQRLDVLNAAARADVTFLLDTMRQTFHRVYDRIVERYKREIESINEMANVFCVAIEEKRPIQQELVLDDDQFVVRPNILMFPEAHELAVPIKEALSPLRFRIVQLGRLTDIFQRIAPRGIVSERVLIYVLQDLVACGEEDCYPPFVPCAWRQLRPPDIEILIERLFGAAEYIEWREFILYAMDLPVPSHEDILKARAAFRMHDPESREVVTCEQFHSTALWFLEISTLYKSLTDEKLDHSNSDTIKNIMLRQEAQLGERVSSLKSDFIERSEDESSTILRLMLAKELLCRMYLVNPDSVHYTAMLLAFCKDENPSEGLGKAFTLAMGAKVCTDVVKGERYVEQLVKQKRCAKELKLTRNYLRKEANEVVREIVDYIVNKATEIVAVFERSRNDYLNRKRRIMIQQLNGSGEIDPAELLPPEEIAEHLVVDNPSDSDEHEHKQSLVLIENETLKDHKRVQQDERVIFWLPRNVCLTVLSTCLPWLASQENLFETTLSLHEGIARVYDELRDEELNEDKDLALAHRLVSHSFICELLRASSKFTSKNMAKLLRSILKDEDGAERRDR
ncbi:PREDICTED: sperm flagellar protein 2-like [Wasmannia auropunctata]|uniref:sperm flagellar protein 2-like n=1 Tax=Wasmannia auropunctata TaxID=64793 RepID=UPI0005F071CC|nr:PREDICTED: sperm flagellar protein 2-like [Wasmannia auropunctata]